MIQNFYVVIFHSHFYCVVIEDGNKGRESNRDGRCCLRDEDELRENKILPAGNLGNKLFIERNFSFVVFPRKRESSKDF